MIGLLSTSINAFGLQNPAILNLSPVPPNGIKINIIYNYIYHFIY